MSSLYLQVLQILNDLIRHDILCPPEGEQIAPPTQARNQSRQPDGTTNHAPTENMNENVNRQRQRETTRDPSLNSDRLPATETCPRRGNNQSHGRGPRPDNRINNSPPTRKWGNGIARSRSPLQPHTNRRQISQNDRSEMVRLTPRERKLIIMYRK